MSHSKKMVKTGSREENKERRRGGNVAIHLEEHRRTSYREAMMGINHDTTMEEDDVAYDGDISNDDALDAENRDPWFAMGMTKAEKYEGMKSWHLSLIIKLVGCSIRYQFLLRRIHIMWKIQHPITLIHLSDNFCIVKFTHSLDYTMALLKEPWVIGDYYLHMQC